MIASVKESGDSFVVPLSLNDRVVDIQFSVTLDLPAVTNELSGPWQLVLVKVLGLNIGDLASSLWSAHDTIADTKTFQAGWIGTVNTGDKFQLHCRNVHLESVVIHAISSLTIVSHS